VTAMIGVDWKSMGAHVGISWFAVPNDPSVEIWVHIVVFYHGGWSRWEPGRGTPFPGTSKSPYSSQNEQLFTNWTIEYLDLNPIQINQSPPLFKWPPITLHWKHPFFTNQSSLCQFYNFRRTFALLTAAIIFFK
jgi:hypothetical protein